VFVATHAERWCQDGSIGVGPEPEDPEQQRSWQLAHNDLQAARRLLGREQARGRDVGLERD
jgi:hypothetical protein